MVPALGDTALLNSDLRIKCTDRFQRDNPDDLPSLDDLIDYLDLGDAIQLLRRNNSAVDDSTQTYLKRYYFRLESLIPVRNRVMHSRPLEFDDLMRVSDFSRELIYSHRSLWANLRTNIRSLDRDPDYAATMTIPEIPDNSVKILHNLPQPEFDDTGFMGREKDLASLKKALTGTYPIVTVVGEADSVKQHLL